MEQIPLEVQVRSEVGAGPIKKVRREDYIPAVVYGGNEKNTIIKIDRRTFERIARQHRSESVLLHLNVLEGEKKLKDYAVIIKEIQRDPVTDNVLHIDFNRISLTEELEVKVQIIARGEPVGVKQEGGSLDHPLWELTVQCLPTNIPERIEVDVSNLNIHDAIHVKDLVLPAGVKTINDPEGIVFSVVPPMKEIEEEPTEEAGAAEPEVIKEKKETKEGAAEEKAEAAEKKPAKQEKPEKQEEKAEG